MGAAGFTELDVEKLKTSEGVILLNQMLQRLFDLVAGDGQAQRVFRGIGTPENVVAAGIGSIYLRRDGGANTSVYVKESDDEGATGWVAK